MKRYQTALRAFEMTTVIALELLIVFTVATATIILATIYIQGMRTQMGHIVALDTLQPALEQYFSGILMVLLGLELLETLKIYFSERHIRIEVILVVAMIGVGRNVIRVELAHTPASTLVGLAALILALSAGYFLVKWSAVTTTARSGSQ
jgi:uncharacterized membrane protein (DUF373 family)